MKAKMASKKLDPIGASNSSNLGDLPPLKSQVKK